jgi:hypothetical protein
MKSDKQCDQKINNPADAKVKKSASKQLHIPINIIYSNKHNIYKNAINFNVYKKSITAL